MLTNSSKKYQCSQCTYTTDRKYNYDRHTVLVHRCNDDSITQNNDNLPIIHNDLLNIHNNLSNIHNNLPNIHNNLHNTHTELSTINIPVEKESFKCTDCYKSFTTKYTLQRHIPICTGRQEPNQCTACLKCFSCRSGLCHHKKFCKGIKNGVKCEYCDQIFSLEKFRDKHYVTCEMKTLKEQEIIPKKKKQSISATMRRLVWNTHIGEEIGKTKCLCCKITDITQLSFNCGHIVSEANNGQMIVSNLKPICQYCNSSMGTTNMDDFMKSLV